MPSALKRLYPWLCWFLASCFIFYKYLLQVSPSVMMPELMHAFDLTGAAIGSLAACYYYAYLVMQLPVGILLDRFSPRLLISGAILVCAGGALVFGHASHLASAQIGRLLIGVGGAFSAVGTMKIISNWFAPQRFALVSGMMMSMAMLGAIGGEAPLSYLIDHNGWRHTMQLCAIAGMLLAALVFGLIRDKKSQTLPASSPSTFDGRVFFQGIIKLLKNKQTWWVSLYSGLAFAPVSAFAGLWGVPFIMQKYAMHRGLTASLVSLAFIGFAIGSPFAGWLSDKVQRRKPIMLLGTAVSLITLSTIIYSPIMPHALLGLLFLCFGTFSGFFFVSFANIREIHPHHLSGTSIGFINMFDALVGAASEPLIGKLLDLGWQHHLHHGARVFSSHNYEHALLILPVGLCIALVAQLFVKETYCQAV